MSLYRQGIANNVTFAAAGGTSAQSNAFGAQTYAIRVAMIGAYTATSGVRINIGDGAAAVASSSTALLPVNEIEYILVTPGQKIAALSNDTVTGTLSVIELTH